MKQALTVIQNEARRQAETAAIRRFNFDTWLGPLLQYITDSSVQNVNVNADGRIWVDRGEKGKSEAPERMPLDDRRSLISWLATEQKGVVDHLHSRLAGTLPYYQVRFQAFCPPAGEWILCLRCHAGNVYPLSETRLTLHGAASATAASCSTLSLTDDFRTALQAAVLLGRNIIISGKPGAGKTTWASTLLHESARVRPGVRCVTLEDQRELVASHADAIALFAKVEQAHPDGTRYEYDFPMLLADALRTSFDMLAFGEIRDSRSALGLMLAANTGVTGLLCTLHADSALDALQRIEDLIAMTGVPVVHRTIARLFNTVVHLEMDDEKRRRVAQIMHVNGVDASGDYVVRYV